MIEISFTEPNELDVSGSISEMNSIKEELIQLSEGSATECIIEANRNHDPSPYKKALNSLKALVTQGPTKISVVNNEMVIEGSRESYKGFSSFFNFEVTATPGFHHHHDYFEGNIYVHPKSISTVMSIK